MISNQTRKVATIQRRPVVLFKIKVMHSKNVEKLSESLNGKCKQKYHERRGGLENVSRVLRHCVTTLQLLLV